jgi:hypothetical protein
MCEVMALGADVTNSLLSQWLDEDGEVIISRGRGSFAVWRGDNDDGEARLQLDPEQGGNSPTSTVAKRGMKGILSRRCGSMPSTGSGITIDDGPMRCSAIKNCASLLPIARNRQETRVSQQGL